MKKRTRRDDDFARRFAEKLADAIEAQSLTREEAAEMLEVKTAVLYKYLRAAAIPGGNVMQRACKRLGLVLDYRGLRLSSSSFEDDVRPQEQALRPVRAPAVQLKFPFVRETIRSKNVRVEIGPSEITIKLAR
jgi:hypothetical protein